MAQEKNYENKIKKYLSEKGIWHVKFFGGYFTRAGIPDLICCVNGKFLAIEVKSDIGKATPLQLRQINLIKQAKGVALVTHPKDFEELKNIIENLLKEN